jgi:hypothetical protein
LRLRIRNAFELSGGGEFCFTRAAIERYRDRIRCAGWADRQIRENRSRRKTA